jgi:hypothetical protein
MTAHVARSTGDHQRPDTDRSRSAEPKQNDAQYDQQQAPKDWATDQRNLSRSRCITGEIPRVDLPFLECLYAALLRKLRVSFRLTTVSHLPYETRACGDSGDATQHGECRSSEHAGDILPLRARLFTRSRRLADLASRIYIRQGWGSRPRFLRVGKSGSEPDSASPRFAHTGVR